MKFRHKYNKKYFKRNRRSKIRFTPDIEGFFERFDALPFKKKILICKSSGKGYAAFEEYLSWKEAKRMEEKE